VLRQVVEFRLSDLDFPRFASFEQHNATLG
jgi:hypothetical protein